MVNRRYPTLVVGLGFLALALYPSAALAQERRQFELPTVTQGPVVMGDLSCPTWAQAAVLDDFQLLKGEGTPEAPTEVRVIADERHLYVGFLCHEPNMDKLVTDITQPGGNVWADDCVEVLVDPTNARTYHHHFIVNSKAVMWQGLHSVVGSLPRPEGEIEVKTALGTDRWSCELKIPFSLLGANFRPGEVWGMNFARERKAGLTEISSWQVANSFTDSTQLGEARMPLSVGPVHFFVTSRGGVMSLFNDHGQNEFSVNVSNTGAQAAMVKLVVLTDDTPIATTEALVEPAHSAGCLLPTRYRPRARGGFSSAPCWPIPWSTRRHWRSCKQPTARPAPGSSRTRCLMSSSATNRPAGRATAP